jgi:hypothetical protein
MDAYNKERKRATEEIKKSRKDKLTERRSGEPAQSVKKSRLPKTNPKVLEMEQSIMQFAGVIQPVVSAGGNRSDIVEALRSAGVDTQTAKRWAGKKGSIEKLFPKGS